MSEKEQFDYSYGQQLINKVEQDLNEVDRLISDFEERLKVLEGRANEFNLNPDSKQFTAPLNSLVSDIKEALDSYKKIRADLASRLEQAKGNESKIKKLLENSTDSGSVN